MSTSTAAICGLVVLLAGASAQSTSFAGAWRLDSAASYPPGPTTSEVIWNVTQTATELRIRTVVNGRETSSYTWPLDGTPMSNTRDGVPNTTSVTIGNGELLIAGTATLTDGATADVREQWIIDPATKSLRVAKVTATAATTFTRRLVLNPVPAP